MPVYPEVIIVSPTDVLTPPRAYGGTELHTAILAQGLAQRGYDVMVMAADGSTVESHHHRIRLVPVAPQAVLDMPEARQSFDYRIDQWQKSAQNAAENLEAMDLANTVILNSMGHMLIDAVKAQAPRACQYFKDHGASILHGRLDVPDENSTYRRLHDFKYISISDAQRRPLPGLTYLRTIHHGLKLEDFRYYSPEEKEDYALFFGRITPEKGTHLAIQAALATDMSLVIAGKIDPTDQSYFDEAVRPYLDDKITYVGEADHTMRNELLGRAAVLLHLNQTFPEPFGLVLIESLACGTPVIAWDNGSPREIFGADLGRVGLLCQTETDVITNLAQIHQLDSGRCRRVVADRFTAKRMIDETEEVVQQLAA